MTVLRTTKNVLSGSAEYVFPAYATTGSTGLIGGDSIELLFDKDVILDDIIVQAITSGTNIDIDLYLNYPTGNGLRLTASAENITSTTPFQLNDDSSDRNAWFRVPKWTTLGLFLNSVQPASAGDGAFQIIVIARG